MSFLFLDIVYHKRWTNAANGVFAKLLQHAIPLLLPHKLYWPSLNYRKLVQENNLSSTVVNDRRPTYLYVIVVSMIKSLSFNFCWSTLQRDITKRRVRRRRLSLLAFVVEILFNSMTRSWLQSLALFIRYGERENNSKSLFISMENLKEMYSPRLRRQSYYV